MALPKRPLRQTRALLPVGLALAALLSLNLMGCEREGPLLAPYYEPVEVERAANFPPPIIPQDNALTHYRVELGRKLFFDPILSRDSTVACVNCHFPEKAFTDGKPVSIGIDGRTGVRNAPTLANMVFSRNFFWDGGVPTLEDQAMVPIAHPDEMDLKLEEAVARLASHPTYPDHFLKAYQGPVSLASIIKALSAFQRTLISDNSAYDRYLAGDSAALSPSARRGMTIFFGENAECFHCHGTILFTDHSFHNNGLYKDYEDHGRYLVTNNPRDDGKFKTPTLRNIALTAPYMHDGSLNTLDEVLDHYSTGGQNHPQQSNLIRPFPRGFSAQEREDLKAFLHSLTDSSFITDFRREPEFPE